MLSHIRRGGSVMYSLSAVVVYACALKQVCLGVDRHVGNVYALVVCLI